MERPQTTDCPLAAFVFHRRRSLGLTKQDLAKVARVSADSVDMIERGNVKSIPSGVLRALARPLGVSLVFLQRLADTDRRSWPTRETPDRRQQSVPVPFERRSGFDRRVLGLPVPEDRRAADRPARA